MDSSPKLRAFLLLRYTLIIATAYLLIAERQFASLPPLSAVLIAAALAVNLITARLPRAITDSMRFAMAVLVYDTAWVTAALISSGQFSAEFFLLYFFLLLLAAIGENLRLIAVGACVVCAAYLFGHSATGGARDVWTSPSLIRVPFLFTIAVFYGYLVERTRRETARAADAEALARQLSRTLAELRVLYAKAQESERIKTEFLATVSHELRTPLTSLIGYVELLIDESFGRVTAEQRGALGRVRAAGRILQQAIGRMLDASGLECGHERLRCTEFAIDGVFETVRADARAADGVALQWQVEQPMPPLRSDAEKLGTIVRNLVENACKYTPHGTIRIAARWDRRRDEIDIRISDTGIGIAPADLDGVFAAFRQGGNRGDLARNGVGLGLFIVQRLTARLGGDVSVESRLGMGSTFILRIPRLLHGGAAVPVAIAEERQWARA